MAQDLVYPTSAELKEVAQVLLPRLMKDRPIFEMFPVAEVKAHRLMWEQKDNYIGLQQVRGLNGEPQRVRRIGAKRYEMEPGIYGEFITIDEAEITTRRAYGTAGTPINIADLVLEGQNQLLQRRLDRIELIGWTLLTTGTFAVSSTVNSSLLHTDTFPIQTFTASVTWATSATATPLQNFRGIELLSRGQSVNFGSAAKAYVNRTTANQLVANTNQNDLAGRRVTGLLSPLNIGEINTILAGEALPQIVIYDEGYIDESGTFQLYIPNGKVVVIGQRPAGQTVGEYRMTINANNPAAAPGAYTKTIDTADTTERPPRKIEVHDGHNGGPALYFPGAIVSMNV